MSSTAPGSAPHQRRDPGPGGGGGGAGASGGSGRRSERKPKKATPATGPDGPTNDSATNDSPTNDSPANNSAANNRPTNDRAKDNPAKDNPAKDNPAKDGPAKDQGTTGRDAAGSDGGSGRAAHLDGVTLRAEQRWLTAVGRRTDDDPASRNGSRPLSPAPDEAPVEEPLPADRFLNRELSWLDFNARVLSLAEDPRVPLLERAKFLAIFASNLDEFYMVRVAGLKRRMQMGLPVEGPHGLTPGEQLTLIAHKTPELVTRQSACFIGDVLPALTEQLVQIVRWVDLEAAERERLRSYFRDHIFPVLTPLAVDPAHPFPYISGLSLNLAVVVKDPEGGPELFARVKVPNNVPRFVSVGAPGRSGVMEPSPDGGPRGARFLPLEELIAAHLGQLFSGMQIIEHHLFRVTRNAELEVDDDRDEDLLQALERELARRRFGPPVRLEVASTISDEVLDKLVRELAGPVDDTLDDRDVLRVGGLLDLSALWQIYEQVDRPDLKDRSFVPATHPLFAEGETPRSVFARLRDGDILVHHPYHSFSTSVQRFIEQAAADPNVLAIKQTLYRTSGDSPVVDALIAAARAGKQVVVLVEVKARFDEQANIGWARMLERAGCHVVYGLVGLKTHCKTAMVVRQEGGQLRRYCHIGTGNYHPKTARVYEDFGLLTADPAVGSDLTDLFNVLTGYSRQTGYRRLLVAPHGVRSGIVERIEREIDHVRRGRGGHIQIKVNSIVDEDVIDALYRASRAGVAVDLVVRGICTLRPGVAGLSDGIRVRSVVGRFLEHSRVMRFANGGDDEFWIGSADLMHRNLDRRVEALVQVTDATAQAQLRRVFDSMLSNETSGFDLDAEGVWHRRAEPGHEDVQENLLRRALGRGD